MSRVSQARHQRPSGRSRRGTMDVRATCERDELGTVYSSTNPALPLDRLLLVLTGRLLSRFCCIRQMWFSGCVRCLNEGSLGVPGGIGNSCRFGKDDFLLVRQEPARCFACIPPGTLHVRSNTALRKDVYNFFLISSPTNLPGALTYGEKQA